MKLLDTLVEHLKDWPEQISHLWCGQGNSIYGKTGPFEFTFTGGWDLPDDHVSATVTRAEWQAAVDALNAPKVVEWDGVGRPPEGTVCGLWYKGCDQGECTVLFMGSEVGVFKSHTFDHEQHGDLVHYSFYKVEGSTEEKDAQERKKAIAEMTEIAGGQYSPRDSIVQRLFDAGYRKEPKPCGS